MSLAELVESELPPGGKMEIEVGLGAGKDPAGVEKQIPKKKDIQEGKPPNPPIKGAGEKSGFLVLHRAMETNRGCTVNRFFSVYPARRIK
jgi:hypothetical protein